MRKLLILVLIAAFLPACSNSTWRLSFDVAVAADIYTTNYGLHHGYAEANPIIRANPILIMSLSSIFATWCAEWLMSHGWPTAGRIIYALGAFTHGGAAIWNARQLGWL